MIRLILLTDFTEAFAHNLLKGILAYSKEHEPWVVCRMPPSYRDRHGLDGVLKWACEWKANAIIARFDNTDDVSLFRQHGIVALAQDFKDRFTEIPNITSDYRLTGKMAADLFLQKGFRHFAFCGYKEAVWSQERYEGFRACIASQGLEANLRVHQEQLLENIWSYDYTLLAEWIRSLPYPTALLACDDMQGTRVAEVCRIHGIKIPEEIAVLGVDNDEMTCNLSNPPLSSVELNIEQGGYKAAQLIDQLLQNVDAPFADVIIPPMRVVNRHSTDVYATSDPCVLLALRYIHQNLTKKIGVADIVREVPLSRRLLEMRFKQVTNQPVYQYIFHLRMERFAELLLLSDAPIGEVAVQAGLVDYKNLARQFKKQRGCSPSEFRKQQCAK